MAQTFLTDKRNPVTGSCPRRKNVKAYYLIEKFPLFSGLSRTDVYVLFLRVRPGNRRWVCHGGSPLVARLVLTPTCMVKARFQATQRIQCALSLVSNFYFQSYLGCCILIPAWSKARDTLSLLLTRQFSLEPISLPESSCPFPLPASSAETWIISETSSLSLWPLLSFLPIHSAEHPGLKTPCSSRHLFKSLPCVHVATTWSLKHNTTFNISRLYPFPTGTSFWTFLHSSPTIPSNPHMFIEHLLSQVLYLE